MTLPARDTPKPLALRRRKTPAVLATSYVAVLAGAWVTTCVLSSRTIRQSADNSGAVTRDTAVHLDRVAFLIDVLNFLTALAAMPVIYALLARAAVVFSQRTSREKTLGVRQLFALADRKFLGYCGSSKDATVGSTRLAQLGGLLILSAIILPPIRAIFVHTDTKPLPEKLLSADYSANGWASTLVGLDPPISEVRLADRRHIVENTRQALITTFPTEREATAWRDPSRGPVSDGGFFATTLPKDATTGMYRQHALRMHSTSSCDDIQWSEYPASCSGDEDQRLEASYDNANLTVKVCVPHMSSNGSPWNETHNRQDLTEIMYISVSSPPLTGMTYGNLIMRCMGQTSMGYFEVGNSFNGGRFGPLLPSFERSRKSKGEGEFTDGITTQTHTSYSSRFYHFAPMFDLDYNSDTEYYGQYVAPGPLALTARALFGSGSFFDLAQSITQPNDTISQTLCHMSPIPFQRVLSGLRRCEPDSTATGGPIRTGSRRKSGGPFASDFGWANDRVYNLIDGMRSTSGYPSSLLTTGMYFANQATLQVATTRDAKTLGQKYPVNLIVHAEGIPVRTPVVSTVALSVVTVLLALQVVGIAALVWYIYTTPTWTDTLDAMAVAGVTSQLVKREGGFLRSDGFWDTTEKQLKEMNKLDGLVGVVGTMDGEPGDSTPLSTATDEATMVGDAAPALGPGYILRVGAPGLIPRRLQTTRKSLV